MSCQCMEVPLKNQTSNIFVGSTNHSGHVPSSRINYWSHMVLIYGKHVSPVISVTHTRCGKDPADIPKRGKDPTTSPIRQRKISKNTSHVMQGTLIFGDDITKSTVLTMVIKVIIPATDKEIS